MQKWADKEGSSALAVWKGFVFVLVFEFSVATRHIHDNLEKITFSTNIWTFPELMTNTEITYILQNLQLDCRIYPSIVGTCATRAANFTHGFAPHISQTVFLGLYQPVDTKYCTLLFLYINCTVPADSHSIH